MSGRPKIAGISLPRSVAGRRAIGAALCAGGVLGFLPVVGFWMLPLGIVVLSMDSAWLRRQRRHITIWWGRRRNQDRT
ncbi:MAG: hypothetical protein RIC36_05590 [Rhodospirillales bacterium]